MFNGAPAFFNCRLNEDTDFSLVRWPKAMPELFDVEYAIRAWERLELMMSQLEKPLDRHRFFRLKMRTRRLKDGMFPRVVNYLFDVSSDYGWNLTRAAVSWVGHWLAFGLVLFVNAGQAAVGGDALKLLGAAFGTAFANAHAFLTLAGKGGYLESCRVLIGQHDHLGLLAAVGVTQAILGPVLLFVLVGPPRAARIIQARNTLAQAWRCSISEEGPGSRAPKSIGASCPKASLGPSERPFTGEACLQVLPHIRLSNDCHLGPGPSRRETEGMQ